MYVAKIESNRFVIGIMYKLCPQLNCKLASLLFHVNMFVYILKKDFFLLFFDLKTPVLDLTICTDVKIFYVC